MAYLGTPRQIPTNTFKSANPLIGTVLENYRLTAPGRPPPNDVRHLVISSEGLSYIPGQSIGAVPDGYDPRTGKHQKLRLYSVSSESKGDYGDGKTVSVVVVRHFWTDAQTGQTDIPGVCSKMLCDCEPGDQVKISGPAGKRFVLPTDFHDRDMIFVATGTGIAPFRGMLKEMFDQNYRGSAFLFFGVQYADTILYDNEFKSYLDRPNFLYSTATSREGEKNPFPDIVPTTNDKMYVHVRMWQMRDQLAASLKKPDTLTYVCGLKGMEAGVSRVIDGIGEGFDNPALSEQIKAEGRLLLEVY